MRTWLEDLEVADDTVYSGKIWSHVDDTAYLGKICDRLRESINNSLSFGLYGPDGQQVGFVRVVSDYVRFAWLSDLYILEEHRHKGLGKWLVSTAMAYHMVADVDCWVLASSNEQEFFSKFSFESVSGPRFMAREKFGNSSGENGLGDLGLSASRRSILALPMSVAPLKVISHRKPSNLGNCTEIPGSEY
ncbi:hypothetical protein CBR_g650 [Chara braunii]|uniref:N-acetyltransferase domain-containing protein n=1 Tax=Chara braunii TaxID=69332 RepID=A0A388KBU8_CHABU|nr:hypothetical protein CBR_g650 [Chara braunii]|eukprot:GBG67520.1 hypothetical protein CBR_g650 [Chara braunii]